MSEELDMRIRGVGIDIQMRSKLMENRVGVQITTG
jgi:hypothetical protein